MDKFIVNIIHRPEMVPEYSATVTGQGKEEDIGDKALLTESLDISRHSRDWHMRMAESYHSDDICFFV